MRRILLFSSILCLTASHVSHIVSAHGVSDGRHGVNLVGANYRTYDAATHAMWGARIAQTGVRWALLGVEWFQCEDDNNPPTDSNEGGDRWQGPSGQWHRYDLSRLDALMSQLTGVNVVISLYHHPRWAGGQPRVGFYDDAGRVYDYKKATFKAGVSDLAARLRERYHPQIAAFAPWNEPNGRSFFSPETQQSPVAEYLNVIHRPVREAIRAVEDAPEHLWPHIPIVAPELAGPNDSGQGYGTDEFGHTTHWLYDWTFLLLNWAPGEIDAFSFHTYNNDYHWPQIPVSQVQTYMANAGVWRPIWITELNMTAPVLYTPTLQGIRAYGYNTEQAVANYFCEVYRRMDGVSWQRTFFVGLHDGDTAGQYPYERGNALLRAATHQFEPKWLHTAFHAITDGNYYCYGP